MEEIKYEVELKKISENDCLVFNIDGEVFEINLNSEEQLGIKKLFFKIIDISFKHKPIFELSEESNNYPIRVFVEISKAYLKDLNDEICKAIENSPSLE